MKNYSWGLRNVFSRGAVEVRDLSGCFRAYAEDIGHFAGAGFVIGFGQTGGLEINPPKNSPGWRIEK
jgi:hypothetical protein